MSLFEKNIQGTAVSVNGHGVLFQGSAGVGKSLTALRLLCQGAQLISDDITHVVGRQEGLFAVSPDYGVGCLEVRNIGIVSGFSVCKEAPICAVIELTKTQPNRWQEPETTELEGYSLPLYRLWSGHVALADMVNVIIGLETGMLTRVSTLTERERK